ncbi:hypothetical protein PHYC_01937 [Phycisphaerales bacterium]|nr:hypothetical protein PHYC_01937 [Phycisphaerales bacterium]
MAAGGVLATGRALFFGEAAARHRERARLFTPRQRQKPEKPQMAPMARGAGLRAQHRVSIGAPSLRPRTRRNPHDADIVPPPTRHRPRHATIRRPHAPRPSLRAPRQRRSAPRRGPRAPRRGPSAPHLGPSAHRAGSSAPRHGPSTRRASPTAPRAAAIARREASTTEHLARHRMRREGVWPEDDRGRKGTVGAAGSEGRGAS